MALACSVCQHCDQDTVTLARRSDGVCCEQGRKGLYCREVPRKNRLFEIVFQLSISINSIRVLEISQLSKEVGQSSLIINKIRQQANCRD